MTGVRRRRLFAGIVFLAGLVSLPNPALAGGPVELSRAADNPIQAVRGLIHSYYIGSKGQRMVVPTRYIACAPSQQHISSCPVTPRFMWRLQHPDPVPSGCLGGCTLDPVSRTENTTQHLSIWLIDDTGSVAHVKTRWGYTYGALRFTFVVRRSMGGWRVDDEYCAGHPDATVYRVPVRPCP